MLAHYAILAYHLSQPASISEKRLLGQFCYAVSDKETTGYQFSDGSTMEEDMIEELVNLPGVVSVSSRRQPDASIIFEVYVTALEPSIHEPIAQKELEWFDRFSETATTIQVREAHTSTSLLTAHAV